MEAKITELEQIHKINSKRQITIQETRDIIKQIKLGEVPGPDVLIPQYL